MIASLVENALEASEPDQVVRVSLSRERKRYELAISDQGRGMSEEVRARAFDFGISEKRSESRIGLRLGLPYARRVVEELDGHVALDSELGEGTRITLVLPAAQAPSETA